MLRAEAAGLLQLFCRLRETHPAPLLVFVDSLVLLNILQHWGKANFNPYPNFVVHFDVILSLIEDLCQWPYPVRMMKVKSHTGCLLNERADPGAESPAARPRTGSRMQKSAASGQQRQRTESQHDEKSAVGANTRRASCRMLSAIFVRQLLHKEEGETIVRVVSLCSEAEYRVWVKAMTGRYPVQAYLHRIKLVLSQK